MQRAPFLVGFPIALYRGSPARLLSTTLGHGHAGRTPAAKPRYYDVPGQVLERSTELVDWTRRRMALPTVLPNKTPDSLEAPLLPTVTALLCEASARDQK